MIKTRSFGDFNTGSRSFAPRLLGRNGAVASEHYLSCFAARDVLQGGGNAVDAAVAATLVEGVVNPNMHTIGGECPMLIKMVDQPEVVSINGNTVAPAMATPEAFRQRGLIDVPEEGVLAAGVPAALHALVTVLSRFGKLSFHDVVQPALDLASHGFPVHEGLIGQPNFGIRDLRKKILSQWPGSAQVYLPGGEVPDVGDVLSNPALALMFDTLINAEKTAQGGRPQKLTAVLEAFYRGDIAREIHAFVKQRDGLLTSSDLDGFETRLEVPVSAEFEHYTIFKCGPWNQGPVMLQALAMLKHFDLERLGHNSADYLHIVIETIKLAFADREQYYGDPEHTEVPIDALLSDDYARLRRDLVDTSVANPEIRPGDPVNNNALLPASKRLGGAAWGAGTVHVDVIDREGNMAAFTPSGAWIKSSEVIPALGFPLGNRLMTFYLGPSHHPNLIAPGKRPRTTISPTLVYKQGKPWMVYGSMGGDQQDQWMLQFFLNRAVFGMEIQQAIEAPKFSSEHFPGFFAPHDHFTNRVVVEPMIGAETLKNLGEKGHDVVEVGDWTEGYLLAAARDPESGLLEAGFDPRGAKSSVFPAYALCW